MESICINHQNSPASAPLSVAEMQSIIEQQQKEIRLLKEKIDYLLRQRFSPKSERFDDRQGRLFDESPDAEDTQEEAETESISYTRSKKGGRRNPPAHLPRVRIEHDLSDEEKRCRCGVELVRIGEESAEHYDVMPPVFQVLLQVRFKYACPCCKETMKTAPAPDSPLPRHQASPGLLAWLGTGKFVDGLPLHRQAAIMGKRFGVPFNPTTLADWMIKSHERLLKPLIKAMRHHFLASDYVQADETTLQVLGEADRQAWQKSYIWLRATASGTPIILMDYRASRAGHVADELLSDFRGYLQTDGYAGYNGTAAREDVIQLGCWAHVRRKFDVAAKTAIGEGAKAQARKALGYIQKLYQIERILKDRPPDERREQRQIQSQPILDEFRQWIDETLHLAEIRDGVLKKAYVYLLNQWPKLIVFLQDGRLYLDNNRAEQHNRPIAQGRKQWLFAQSEAGAHATAAWYSVIATAKANGWEPYHYLKRLFTELPRYLKQGLPVDELLPWNLAMDVPIRQSGLTGS